MINILVTGAGGDVGQGIIKSLIESDLDIEIFTICISPHSAWLHKVNQSFIAPLSESPGYIPFLLRLINKYNIRVLFPGVDGEILKLAENKNLIERNTGCLVFVGDVEKVRITDDKLETVRFLERNGFIFPLTVPYNSEDIDKYLKQVGFPFVLKSRFGQGSKEVFILNSNCDLVRYPRSDKYILQQWINSAGGEYTSGIYLGQDGKCTGICTFKRQLKNGSTYIAQRIIDKDLESPLVQMAEALGLRYLNIQSMRSDDQLIPFEFNGRLSGTTAMVSKVFNVPEMFIKEMILGLPVIPCDNDKTFVAMRFYDEVYTTADKILELQARSKEV